MDMRTKLTEFFKRTTPIKHEPLRTNVAEEWTDEFLAMLESNGYALTKVDPEERRFRIGDRVRYTGPILNEFWNADTEGTVTGERQHIDVQWDTGARNSGHAASDFGLIREGAKPKLSEHTHRSHG